MFFITAVIVGLPRICLSDIVVTTDGMILNGKIIENIKGDHAKLANEHGIFKIQYSQIKELHHTDNYLEDMKILKKMGRRVSEAEIKTNYQAGIKKLKETKISSEKTRPVTMEYALLVSPFFLFNMGKIYTFLPYSYGVIILGDIRFNSNYRYLPNGLRIDLNYFHTAEGEKKISAFRFGLGAIWNIPITVRGGSFNLTLSPVFGGGYYSVKSGYDQTTGIKFNGSVSAGLEFYISSWVISPQVRFDYVYDRVLPLYGIGISIGAGYLFKI